MKYVVLGFCVGWISDDILNALGMHWLVLPVITFLSVFVVGSIILGRRDDKRS